MLAVAAGLRTFLCVARAILTTVSRPFHDRFWWVGDGMGWGWVGDGVEPVVGGIRSAAYQ